MERIRTLLLVALSCAAGTLAGGSAAALDACKIKTLGSDGSIRVSAKNVDGQLRYGFTPAVIEGTFHQRNVCIVDGVATNCAFAEEGSPRRISPPPSCTLYLEDDSGSCQPRLKRCTPGLRPICPPAMSQLGAECIEDELSPAVLYSDAQAICHARGRSLCSQDTLLRCDELDFGRGPSALSCGAVTDGSFSLALWTSATNSHDGSSAFSNLVAYHDSNEVIEYSISDGAVAAFFCCAPLGTP